MIGVLNRWSQAHNYTAKLLFHQSPTRHSDYTVTGQWRCSHCWQLLAARWLHRWSIVWSPCCRQLTTVTTPSLSSHYEVTVPSGRLMAGGDSHVKAYGDEPFNWVTFSPKILRYGSHFGQKNPYRRVPFHKSCRKMVKSAVFEAEKPLEMGLDLRKLKKKKKLSNQPYFEWEKSLDMGRGFGPQTAHSIKK